MKYSIYILFLLICLSVNAQTNVSTVDSAFLPKLTGKTFVEKKGYKGEQFFSKDWVIGDILLSTGVTIHDLKLKYNGLLDEVIWVNPSNFQQFVLDKSFIREFWLKNIMGHTIHFKRISVFDPLAASKRSDVFVEVEVEGKISLYIQHRIVVVGEENIFQNGALYLLESIGPGPLYYINSPSNTYSVMSKVSRRAFLRLFPEQKKDINKLLRDNHLKFKTESDFIQVVELLNKVN